MAFHFKKLDSGDVRSAKHLFRLFQLDEGAENPTQASDEYLEKLLARDDFHVVVATSENGEVIGGLTAYELRKYKREATEMFLYEIGVAESFRRRGIARELIAFLKRVCAKKEIREMFVATEADNRPAKGLYRRTGGGLEKAAIYSYEV
ncbi:MAG: GNAT family N-acetyltransferase [Pyrinomonadaceae bacterium]